MGWFGKLTFGALGLFLGGPLGAIAGAALGHHLVDKQYYNTNRLNYTGNGTGFEYREQSQAAHFISLFSILGKLSKIDGVVARNEIAVVENLINHLHMAENEKQFARRIFNEAKNSEYAIEDFAMQLYQTSKYQPAVLLSFYNLLFQIVAADGAFHPAEEAAMRKIKDVFRISDRQFEDIRAVYFNDMDKYYKLLGCTPESSEQEIRSQYKKLVKDFHPDTIIAKGLPEEFIDFATKRFREIQEAYEKIRQERNF